MYLNKMETQRYIEATAAEAGLGVRWDEERGYSTDGKVIYLRPLPATAPEVEHLAQHQSVNHEVSHIRHSDFEMFKHIEGHKHYNLLVAVWNGLEDPRVDYLNGGLYAGDRRLHERVYSHKMGKLLDNWAEHKDQLHPEMTFSIWVLNEANKEFLSDAKVLAPQVEELLPAKTKEYVRKYWSTDIHKQVLAAMQIADAKAGTEATLACAKRILTEVMGLEDECESKEDKQQEQEQEGEGTGGKGKDGKKRALKSGGKEKGEGEAEGESTVVRYEISDGRHDKRDMPKRGHHVSYDDWSDGGDGGYTPANRTDYRLIDYTKGLPPTHNIQPEYSVGLGEPRCTTFQHDSEAERQLELMLASGTGKGLANKLRTKLQVRARSDILYAQRKGRLDGSRLYRVPMNVKGYSERVFTTTVEKDTLDTAVFLLGDMSGSMTGSKYAHLGLATVRINDAIGNVLGMPLEVAYFCDIWQDGKDGYGECVPLMVLLRKFSERRVGEDRIVQAHNHVSQMQSANPDADALMWAYHRIMQRKEKRKILFMLSDGSPATGKSGDSASYLRRVAKAIESRGEVELVAVGIEDSNVSLFYKNHAVLADAKDLEGTLLKLLDKHIR